MLRTNLFQCVALILLAGAWSGSVMGQHHGNWQMPGIHVPRSQYQAPVIDYYQGHKPQVWDSGQPVEKALSALAQRSWLRVDYLHWDIEDPGNNLVGAPVLNLTDPLTVSDQLNGGVNTGIGVIPDDNALSLDDTSGIRGTWGLDLHQADFELEFFGTEDNTARRGFTGIGNTVFRPDADEGTVERPNIVVPLLTDGAVQDASSANYLIFNDSFSTSLSSRMWGAEASLLSETYIPNAVTSWQWLGGFRYLAVDEQYDLSGTTQTTQLRSTAINNMYGPEVGFRSGINTQWVTFSVTPRIAFTLNDYTAETTVAALPGNATPTGGRDGDVEFTPIVQVSFTGEVHLTPNFSVFGGYDLMWIYRATRPFDNVTFDSSSSSGTLVYDVTQDITLNSLYTKGLSFGCVYRY